MLIAPFTSAAFGYYHFGVVRALLDQNLLPRVITGTSAGAIGETRPVSGSSFLAAER